MRLTTDKIEGSIFRYLENEVDAILSSLESGGMTTREINIDDLVSECMKKVARDDDRIVLKDKAIKMSVQLSYTTLVMDWTKQYIENHSKVTGAAEAIKISFKGRENMLRHGYHYEEVHGGDFYEENVVVCVSNSSAPL